MSSQDRRTPHPVAWSCCACGGFFSTAGPPGLFGDGSNPPVELAGTRGRGGPRPAARSDEDAELVPGAYPGDRDAHTRGGGGGAVARRAVRRHRRRLGHLQDRRQVQAPNRRRARVQSGVHGHSGGLIAGGVALVATELYRQNKQIDFEDIFSVEQHRKYASLGELPLRCANCRYAEPAPEMKDDHSWRRTGGACHVPSAASLRGQYIRSDR